MWALIMYQALAHFFVPLNNPQQPREMGVLVKNCWKLGLIV